MSVNLGVPRQIVWNNEPVTTSIFKEPITARVKVGRFGLEGDLQADLTVHGGLNKALYAYPSEHYKYWMHQLKVPSLQWGMFGENLTTNGILENDVHVGDSFSFGSAEGVVTQPRFPCYKLGIKFGTMEMVKRFQVSGRSGFYLSVVKEGEVCPGDLIKLKEQSSSTRSIADIFMEEADS